MERGEGKWEGAREGVWEVSGEQRIRSRKDGWRKRDKRGESRTYFLINSAGTLSKGGEKRRETIGATCTSEPRIIKGG